MFVLEIVERVYHTARFSDDEEKEIRNYVKTNLEKFDGMSEKEIVISAVDELYGDGKIDLYNDSVESDSETVEISWSEFEEKTAKEILGFDKR